MYSLILQLGQFFVEIGCASVMMSLWEGILLSAVMLSEGALDMVEEGRTIVAARLESVERVVEVEEPFASCRGELWLYDQGVVRTLCNGTLAAEESSSFRIRSSSFFFYNRSLVSISNGTVRLAKNNATLGSVRCEGCTSFRSANSRLYAADRDGRLVTAESFDGAFTTVVFKNTSPEDFGSFAVGTNPVAPSTILGFFFSSQRRVSIACSCDGLHFSELKTIALVDGSKPVDFVSRGQRVDLYVSGNSSLTQYVVPAHRLRSYALSTLPTLRGCDSENVVLKQQFNSDSSGTSAQTSSILGWNDDVGENGRTSVIKSAKKQRKKADWLNWFKLILWRMFLFLTIESIIVACCLYGWPHSFVHPQPQGREEDEAREKMLATMSSSARD